MEKPVDLTIIDVKQDIIKIINDSNLPLTILQLIINEIQTNINNQLNSVLPKLIEEFKNSSKEEK